MTDPLITTAMLGTERQGAPTDTIPEIDGVLHDMPETTPERMLLLAAGALAIYRLAGALPEPASELLPAAPGETLPVCSPLVQVLVRNLLDKPVGHMLQMVFERMERAGVRLPHRLLVDALSRVEDEDRPALLPVLGERGSWLAHINPVWSWAATEPLESIPDRLPPDAETIWQEGELGPRLQLVELHRRLDPRGALERVQGVFRSEGADMRARLVRELATGLSPIDEPFLEEVLDDRSEKVRNEAASLLARLPESAYVDRMRRRADELLHMSTRQSGPSSTRTLQVTTPRELDPSWKRDGLEKRPRYVSGDVWVWRVQRVVEFVPVQYWIARYAITIDDLVNATDKEWRPVLLEAWTNSALFYKEWELIPALWDACLANVANVNIYLTHRRLTEAMRPDDLLPRLINVFQIRPEDDIGQFFLLRDTPSPWALQVGEVYLERLGRALAVPKEKVDLSELNILMKPNAGPGLPDALVDRGLALLSRVSDQKLLPEYYERHFLRLQKELRMRRRIMEALPE
ncbi:MAG: hypothetical protein NVS4B2_26180 [Chloroflexota bacterium]